MHSPAQPFSRKRAATSREQRVGPHVTQVRKNAGRRVAAEALKVFDHMHLIVIAEVMSDCEPRKRRRPQLGIHCHLVPRDSGKELGVIPISSTNRRSYCLMPNDV